MLGSIIHSNLYCIVRFSEKYTLRIDSIKVFDSDDFWGSQFTFQLVNYKNEEAFCAYYPLKGKIKIYSFPQNKTIKEYNIVEFLSSRGNVESVFFHNKDSIFLLTENSIDLMKEAGNQINLARINDHATINQKGFFIQCRSKNQFYFKNGFLFFPIIQFQKNRYRNPIIGKFNIKSRAYSIVPIYYPSNYLANYYGFNDLYNYCLNDTALLVSFQCNDVIKVYNFNNGHLREVNGKSNNRQAEFISLPIKCRTDDSKKLNLWLKNPIYSDILYDSQTGTTYRIFEKELTEFSSTNALNWNGKKKILQCFNRELKLLFEIELPKKTFNYLFNVSNGSLFFLPEDSTNENNNSVKTLIKLTVKT